MVRVTRHHNITEGWFKHIFNICSTMLNPTPTKNDVFFRIELSDMKYRKISDQEIYEKLTDNLYKLFICLYI